MQRRPLVSDQLITDYQHKETVLLRYRWGDSLFFTWLLFSFSCITVGILININLHYIIGSTVTILGIAIMISAVSINICGEIWANDIGRLFYLDSIFLWIVRVICLVGFLPLFLWASIIMYTKHTSTL
jgi:hypothetical protein